MSDRGPLDGNRVNEVYLPILHKNINEIKENKK